jgi:AAA+ superfamily predicted ATPase
MSIPNQNMMNYQNPSSQNLIEMIKPMLLTMFMVKSNDKNNENNIYLMIWSFVSLSIIEWLMTNLKIIIPILFLFIKNHSVSYFEKKITKQMIFNSQPKVEKKSTIFIHLDTENKNSTITFAILDVITSCENTKNIFYKNNLFKLNYHNEIEIKKDLYVKLCESKENKEKTEEQIELYSYYLNMNELRSEIDIIGRDYLNKIKNKLGNQIFYFNSLFQKTKNENQQNSMTTFYENDVSFHFTMKPFYTNRKFQNLFGDEIKLIKKRVEFYKNNKKWYDEKGIPYTLGILMTGEPGAGKTSTIKCLANELKRHIINVPLTNKTTKTQLENLFYDDIINVTQNGKTEQFCIPIDKRIFVFEDIDCECDIVFDRKDKNKENEKDEKIKELELEIEQLMKIIEDPNPNKIIKLQKTNQIQNHKNSNIVTLSFLLNLLDGILETPGRIVIMTTNFMNKLDSALIRPGRFDIMVEFTKCKKNVFKEMLPFYYDYQLTNEMIERLEKLENYFISPAELSKILFENFENIENAIFSLEKKNETFLMINEKYEM